MGLAITWCVEEMQTVFKLVWDVDANSASSVGKSSAHGFTILTLERLNVTKTVNGTTIIMKKMERHVMDRTFALADTTPIRR